MVDPELTVAPATVTAYAGIDALAHAVESDTTRPLPLDWSGTVPVFTGRNALIEPVALRAAGHLGGFPARAARQPDDRRAREQVALGSLLAGNAFGSTGTHLCHALRCPIGALTKTPHGLGTGLMLPYVVDAIRARAGVEPRLAALGAAIAGIPPAEASAARAVTRIADLALGSTRLIAMAPVPPSRDLLLDIPQRAHAGDIVDRSAG